METPLLERTITDLKANAHHQWSVNFGYQPGVVVLVIAFRQSDGEVVGKECAVAVDAVDELVERIIATKEQAVRARQ